MQKNNKEPRLPSVLRENHVFEPRHWQYRQAALLPEPVPFRVLYSGAGMGARKGRDKMKVSKEIADKAQQWQTLQTQVNNLYKELVDYFESESDIEGFEEPFITDTPRGIKSSNDGEFCNQITLGEDWYKGQYYFPIEDSDKYVGWNFEI